MIVGLIVAQCDLKKLVEKPSGPGALSGWMAKRAFLISTAVGMATSCAFISGVTQGVSAFKTVVRYSVSVAVNRDNIHIQIIV